MSPEGATQFALATKLGEVVEKELLDGNGTAASWSIEYQLEALEHPDAQSANPDVFAGFINSILASIDTARRIGLAQEEVERLNRRTLELKLRLVGRDETGSA